MNTTTQHPLRLRLAAVAALAAIGFTALPASARPDPGQALDQQATSNQTRCALARIGTQFVACDNLTGNGVAAPATVPER